MKNFDKEFVMYLVKYIGENNYNAKKYLNAYYMKFNEIKSNDIETVSKKVINEAFRFWDFEDKKILEYLFGKNITINKTGFLSFFSNIGNTKYMIEFLELNHRKKLFYIIEQNNSEFLNIYIPLENIDENEFSSDELDSINKILSNFKKENEYVKLNVDSYSLDFNNVKSILIHEWLGDLLEIKDMHKLNNGYYYMPINKKNLLKLRDAEPIKFLIENNYLLASKGCSVLDEYYDIEYDELIKEQEIKKEKIEISVNQTPIPIKFKASN